MNSELKELLVDGGKLRVAELARQMANNQRTLDATHRDDVRNRERAQAVDDVLAERVGTQGRSAGTARSGDDMQIYVDSPVTINEPSAARPEGNRSTGTSSRLAKAGMVAALIASGAGIGAAASLMFGGGTKEPAQEVQPEQPSNIYDIEKWTPGQTE